MTSLKHTGKLWNTLQWDNSISSHFGPALSAVYGAIGNCTILSETCVLHKSVCPQTFQKTWMAICWSFNIPTMLFYEAGESERE